MKYLFLILLLLPACAEELPTSKEPEISLPSQEELLRKELKKSKKELDENLGLIKDFQLNLLLLELEISQYKKEHKKCQRLYTYYDASATVVEHIAYYVEEEGANMEYIANTIKQHREWFHKYSEQIEEEEND